MTAARRFATRRAVCAKSRVVGHPVWDVVCGASPREALPMPLGRLDTESERAEAADPQGATRRQQYATIGSSDTALALTSYLQLGIGGVPGLTLALSRTHSHMNFEHKNQLSKRTGCKRGNCINPVWSLADHNAQIFAGGSLSTVNVMEKQELS